MSDTVQVIVSTPGPISVVLVLQQGPQGVAGPQGPQGPAGPVGPDVELIQAKGINAAGAIACDLPVTAGNLLFVFTSYEGVSSPAPPTISDNQGNVYTHLLHETGVTLLDVYSATVSETGALTITSTMTGSYIWFAISEWKGTTANIDEQSSAATGLLTITTTQENDLILVPCSSDSNAFPFNPPPGFSVGWFSNGSDSAGLYYLVGKSAREYVVNPGGNVTNGAFAALAFKTS